MANTYLKMIEDAKALPAIFDKMGTRAQRLDSDDGRQAITGWFICLVGRFGPSPSGWMNEFHLVVDEAGDLWEFRRSQHYEDEGTTIYRVRNLERVDGEWLRRWDAPKSEYFAEIKRSFENLI